MPDLAQFFEAAERWIDVYIERTRDVSYDEKGIRPSEGFFIFATLADDPPRRILESGRARGFSTEILARCFPDAKIISIEFDANSPDIVIAAERLRDLTNVELLFGDARILLPELLGDGDVVLIDGPKDFRALKLAIRLLQIGKPRAVFLHDLTLGIPVRNFLDVKLPEAFFSDEPRFVRQFSFLDHNGAQPDFGASDNEAPRTAYGAAMGCIPAGPRNYKGLLAKLTLLQWQHRLRDSCAKFLRFKNI